MKTWFNNSKTASTAIARWAACLLLILVGFFFTRVSAYAQDEGEPREDSPVARVHFPVDQTALTAGYLDNQHALAVVDSIAALCAADSTLVVEIVSYSSPEGNIAYNKYLSENRSASLREYFLSHYPELWDRVVVSPYAEAWPDLRSAAVSDERLDVASRSKMLEIIDSEMDSDAKELELKKLPAFRAFYRNFFKYFRYAEIRLATAKASTEVSPTRSTILFYLNSTALDRTYAENEQVLQALDQELTSHDPAQYKAIRIVSGSSPDGPEAINERMAGRRGQAVRDYIASKYPSFSHLVVLQNQGEAWGELREMVKSSDSLTAEQKISIINVIDNPALNPQAKEAALRKSSSWSRIQNQVLPLVRYATVIPEYSSADTVATAAPAPAAPVADTLEPARKPAPAQPAPADTITAPVDTFVAQPMDTLAKVAAPADTLDAAPADTLIKDAAPVAEAVAAAAPLAYVNKPLFAVTTNLLYESATVFTGFHSVPLNIGIEVPFGKHWSAYANYMATAPWRAWNNNADCAELLHADLGVKWYPGGTFTNPFGKKENRSVLDGWYAYAAVGSGYYDFERNGKGYQGEEILGSLGIGYGLTLGNNWSLDFAVGGGPIVTNYRYYIGRSNNEHLMYQYSGRLTYFGVTDAKVSLRYLFHYNKKVKSSNN